MVDIQLKILDSLKNNPAFQKSEALRDYRDKGPTYGTTGSAAFDLRANIDNIKYLPAGDQMRIGTGLSAFIKDKGLAGVIIPRSGLGSNDGIVLGNLVGLIDSDYQGEIAITVWNRSSQAYTILPGHKLCQMMLMPVEIANIVVVKEFSESTARGDGGFGSTGL